MNRLLKPVVLMAILMSTALMGTGQAHVGKNGDIAGEGVLACKVTIHQTNVKTDPQTICRGTIGGVVVAQGDNGTTKVCAAVADPAWEAGKVFEVTGGPKKPKHNFIARAFYETPIDPTVPSSANGDFAAYGTTTKNGTVTNCYTQGTFEYTRLAVVAVVTLPCKKANTKCDKGPFDNDIAVGNGTQNPSDGMPNKDPNQIVCDNNPQGGGIFKFTPKAVPSTADFNVQISGSFTIACQ